MVLLRNSSECGCVCGRMLVNGVAFCDTIEREGGTLIPVGKYAVGLTRSERFQKVMIEVFNVPGHSGIRIHAGNSIFDTQGCILVGRKGARYSLVDSAVTRDELLGRVSAALQNEEVVTIRISQL